MMLFQVRWYHDWSSSPEVLAKGLQHLAERQKVGGLRYPAVPRSILWLRTGFSWIFPKKIGTSPLIATFQILKPGDVNQNSCFLLKQNGCYDFPEPRKMIGEKYGKPISSLDQDDPWRIPAGEGWMSSMRAPVLYLYHSWSKVIQGFPWFPLSTQRKMGQPDWEFHSLLTHVFGSIFKWFKVQQTATSRHL